MSTVVARPLDLELRFPPLPRTMQEVTHLLVTGRDNPDLRALIDVVSTDPAVSAALLRRVNSAFYATRGKVATTERAVTLLGFHETCNVALAAGLTGLRAILTSPAEVALHHRLVWRSLGASWFTRTVAERAGLEVAALAFTVGILSTSGHFVLLYNYPAETVALWQAQPGGTVPSAEAERAALGTDHAEAARLAGAHWGLPAPIIEVLGGILVPDQVPPPLNLIAYALRTGLAASDQLCPREGEAAAAFDPPSALGRLAELAGVPAETLRLAVEAERDDALTFMQAIVGG